MRVAGPLILLLLLAGTARAYPTFTPSTFDTGRDGWEPDWAVSEGHLRLEADGVGEKGKLITFNSSPNWIGDYFAAGVTGIALDLANLSTTDDVYLRIALGNRASPQQTGGTWWLSSTPVFLPAGSGWTSAYLPLLETDLQRVGNLTGQLGTDSYADTFRDIQTIRILSAVLPLGAIGDEFVGEVRLDNIRLIPEPSSLLLLLSGAAALTVRRTSRR